MLVQPGADAARTTKGLRGATVVGHALRQLVSEVGEAAAAKRLEPISRSTFARLAGELPCRPANVILASQLLGVALVEADEVPGGAEALNEVRPCP